MESPVIVENCAYFAMPVNQDETGFPFEDDYSFQDRLNNLAQRHPELADTFRLDDFPSLRRKRNGSGSSDHDNSRFGGVGPSSRFGTFGNRFPFSHHFEDEFASEPAQNRQDKPPEVPKTQSQEKRGRKPNPNLPQHLSNTVDLGQKQAPVEEVRSQRSMSAPPENRSTQGSRVENETPVDHHHHHQQQHQHHDMGKSQSRPSEPAAPPQPPQAKERIIPIHVEGRSEPVIPKNTHTHTHQANSGGPPPEPVFGQEKFYQPGYTAKRQQAYDQYRPQGYSKQSTPPHQQQQQPQQSYYQQPQQPHPQQQQQHYSQPPHFQQAGAQQHKQATPPPDNRPNQQPPQPQQQQPHFQHAGVPPQHKQATPPPSEQQEQQQQQRATPPPSNDPLDKIKIVKSDVLALMTNVQNFQGTRKDREYLYLDEMLTRNLIKLDNISTDGKDNIRSARKEAIKCIQTCINNLEAKAQAREKELKAAGEDQQPNAIDQQNQGMESGQNSQEQQQQQTVCPPTFKTEATINLSGQTAEQPGGQEQQQQQMEVEQQQQQQQEQHEKSSNEQQQQEVAAAGVTPMDVDTNEQTTESVQSNSSQPETTSK